MGSILSSGGVKTSRPFLLADFDNIQSFPLASPCPTSSPADSLLPFAQQQSHLWINRGISETHGAYQTGRYYTQGIEADSSIQNSESETEFEARNDRCAFV